MNGKINSKTFILTFKANERGMALLLTLAMLFMLLLMAISFASTATTWRKAAKNSHDLTVARLLAESGVQRAIGAMRFYSTISSTQFYNVRTHLGLYDSTIVDEVGANRENCDFLYKLGTVNSDVEYNWPLNYDPTDPNAVHWQYMYNGLSGASKRIIGRIAYLTVPVGGKLDPAACVDRNSTPGNAVNENGADEERNGRDVKEINIKNLDPASNDFLPASIVSKFSSTNASPAGKLTDGSRWIDWADLFSSSKLDITDKTQKEHFKIWFTLDNTPDPEAFWVDSNTNGVIDSGELYHRFNLTRTDWDALTINNILTNPGVYGNSPSTNDGNGIRWLKNYTNLPPGTFPDAATRAKQIAANLLDYCDTNTDVTSDSVDWSSTDPTYTGNEKTPYINEIGFELQLVVDITKPKGGGNTRHVDMNFYIRPGAEIINMTGENFNAATTMNLQGNVNFYWSCKRDHCGQPKTVDDNEETIPFNISWPLTAVGTSGYKFTWANQYSLFTHEENIQPPPIVYCENVKVQITRARLEYAGKSADFAKPNDASGWSDLIGYFYSINPGNGNNRHDVNLVRFSYQADDPRQNLNPGDWFQGTVSAANADYSTIGTQDAQNTGVTCTVNGDAETGSVPTAISTAYIRKAPMQSPWELGRIHRGAKWETLNLKAYSETDGYSGVSSTAGLGAYASGDANILDQVKMGSDVSVYGKVSVNSGNERVLRALIAKIRVGVPLPNNGSDNSSGTADDNSPGSKNNGTELSYATNVANIASAIVNSGARPFKTRAQIVNVAKLWNGTEATQATDAAKEEIIGKFINLTKAAAPEDTIVIIVLAQTIKDVGDSVVIRKDIDGNGIIGTADENTANVDFNGNGDKTDYIPEIITCQYGVYNQFADEILAEQKVMAIVYRNPVTGKWRTVKYKYLED
jgi:hypothetical protein